MQKQEKGLKLITKMKWSAIDMLSIDEAIAHAREKAKEIRENIIDGDNLEPYESYCNAMVAKSAEEYEQLAEWLEELKEYKALDEQGRLVILPCKDVYYIVDANNPRYAMVMKSSIRELTIYEIENIDKENCKYFSTEEKTEARLKELRGGGNE